MEFKKKLKKRLYIAVAYTVLGLLMTASSFIIHTDDFISSFGFALFLMGIVRIRNYFIITRTEETIKKREITETDERNILIMNRAKSTAFSIYVLLSSFVVIILSFLNMHELSKCIAIGVCVLVVIYWICYMIYQKIS
ncbi:MAG: hypothetical protein E7621_01230 [Ruminococcaceae bacterium]|nr:hypothetical protein [Oscillospiraceae bacterium]